MFRPRSAHGTARKRAERQGALLVSVITLFVLLAAAASTLSLALIRNANAKTAKEVGQAYIISESGVARALYEMQLGTDYGGDGVRAEEALPGVRSPHDRRDAATDAAHRSDRADRVLARAGERAIERRRET